LSLEDRRTARPFLRTPFNEWSSAISPDGRWIAYASNEAGESQVYVQPLPGPGAKQLVSTEGGVAPVWSRDGRELFYVTRENLMVASVTPGPDLQLGKPRLLFKVPQEGDYDAAPDGQSFVMVKTERTFPPTEAIVVLNWLDELKRLVPTQN
jgi:Tol biopolymer transport system component